VNTITHPAVKWPLIKVFEELYAKEDLAAATLWQMRHSLRVWADRVGNVPLGKISNLTIAGFRQSLITDDYAPRTILGYWSRIRSVLNYVGPPSHGNPHALGIIDGFLGMKPVKRVHCRPARVQMEDLSAMYANAWRIMEPRGGIPGPDWWRAVIVLAYTTGLRRGDLWSLEWPQMNLDELTMDFTARKTGKADVWPLHPIAAKHLRRIQNGGIPVFPGVFSKSSGSFYKAWHRLRELSGVETDFCLHDIRRTGASEIERVRPGLAEEFMQHAPRKVTDAYYLNRYEELKSALADMRMPAAFIAGPEVTEQQLEAERVSRIPAAVRTPRGGIDPSEWEFSVGRVVFRGMDYFCPSTIRWRLLQGLVKASPDPLPWEAVLQAAYGRYADQYPHTPQRAKVCIWDLREWVRNAFGITKDVDPIPCVAKGDGGAWTIFVPPAGGVA